jgi:biopolymer transport protein ExbB/TolQ|tara:strand:- start:9146 stop:9559 length:414 start_codon:yes stop_codon:yes gene_type:complete
MTPPSSDPNELVTLLIIGLGSAISVCFSVIAYFLNSFATDFKEHKQGTETDRKEDQKAFQNFKDEIPKIYQTQREADKDNKNLNYLFKELKETTAQNRKEAKEGEEKLQEAISKLSDDITRGLNGVFKEIRDQASKK